MLKPVAAQKRNLQIAIWLFTRSHFMEGRLLIKFGLNKFGYQLRAYLIYF